ncbi:MAG TPA: hypothetical protein VJH92_05980 [Candidatus Nanoarchaeia archaeon]|nr:hypothetical protein [Candidatus Nanoarchaeia archaeon]
MVVFSKYYGLKENLKLLHKYLLSHLKNKWSLEDYPISTKIQTGVLDNSRWSVRILNWGVMGGLGATKEKAFRDLRKNFSKYAKQKKNKLPRPGTKVPLKFAENKLINKHSKLLDDFILRILEMNREEILYLSDISTICDFYPEKTLKTYIKKIKKVYAIDVSNVKDGNIAKILNKIVRNNKEFK